MKNNRWTGITIVAVVLLIVIILGGYFLKNDSEGSNLVSWTPEYRYNAHKDPFDVDVAHSLIISAVGKENFYTLADTGRLWNVLPDGIGNSYFFIGKSYTLSHREAEAMKEFISKGNDVFIIAESMNTISQELFFQEEDGQSLWSNTSVVNSNPENSPDSFTIGPVGNFDTSIMVHWKYYMNPVHRKVSYVQYADNEQLKTKSSLKTLQYLNDDQPCFVTRPLVDGHVYIHTIPMLFSNIYMKDEQFFHHLNGVLHYVQYADMYWDNGTRDFRKPDESVEIHESEFKYIVSQDELRYALYLAIFGVILYILFAMKRVQRPIPIVDSNRNMSIQSLQMVSRLFYLYPDNKELTNTKMTVFLHFVRSRYGLIINDLDKDFYEKLSLVSGVRIDLIQSIFRIHKVFSRRHSVSSTDTINFTNKINRFYNDCK